MVVKTKRYTTKIKEVESWYWYTIYCIIFVKVSDSLVVANLGVMWKKRSRYKLIWHTVKSIPRRIYQTTKNKAIFKYIRPELLFYIFFFNTCVALCLYPYWSFGLTLSFGEINMSGTFWFITKWTVEHVSRKKGNSLP